MLRTSFQPDQGIDRRYSDGSALQENITVIKGKIAKLRLFSDAGLFYNILYMWYNFLVKEVLYYGIDTNGYRRITTW